MDLAQCVFADILNSYSWRVSATPHSFFLFLPFPLSGSPQSFSLIEKRLLVMWSVWVVEHPALRSQALIYALIVLHRAELKWFSPCRLQITKVVLSKGWRCLECTVCEACGKATDPGRLLLCDDCDISYHTYCLDPPLQTVPKGGWKCKWCVWFWYQKCWPFLFHFATLYLQCQFNCNSALIVVESSLLKQTKYFCFVPFSYQFSMVRLGCGWTWCSWGSFPSCVIL